MFGAHHSNGRLGRDKLGRLKCNLYSPPHKEKICTELRVGLQKDSIEGEHIPRTAFLSLPSTTRERKPTCNASAAVKSLPVSATSRVKLSFPIVLGNRASEPTSAAIPIVISYIRISVVIPTDTLNRETAGEISRDLYREDGIGSGITNIARREHVNSESVSYPVHSSNNGYTAFLDRSNSHLKFLQRRCRRIVSSLTMMEGVVVGRGHLDEMVQLTSMRGLKAIAVRAGSSSFVSSRSVVSITEYASWVSGGHND